jgi:glyoxylase-like metal-dependent hydrolase (beta-lactamase superfamily II)
MGSDNFNVASIVSQPFQENTYVAWLEGRSDCLVIDPGLEPHLILDYLRREKLTPAMILNTHGHGDHIGGNATVKQAFPNAPLVIGEIDEPMLSDSMLNVSGLAGFRITSPPADRVVREGDIVEAAGFRLEVRHIPGHSPGHVVFIWNEHGPKIVFGGDVLFAGGVGRWDLPGGSARTLLSGIRDKLLTLPPDTRVLPGHGPETTIATERAANPYVGDHAIMRL